MATIATLPPLPPAADPLRARASTFVASVIPKLQHVHLETSRFVASGKGAVAEMLAMLGPKPSPAMRGALEGLALAAKTTKAHVDALHPILDGYRRGFSEDQGKLQALRIDLDGQLRGVVALRDHWAQELGQRGTQMAVEDSLMFVLPIVKLASEIVSLFRNHDTTEGALAEARHKADELVGQRDALVRTSERVGEAQIHASQLTNTVQFVDNGVSILCGDLDNQAAFFGRAEQAARLYLRALAAGFEQLATALA